MLTGHSTVAHAAYHDLLTMPKDEAVVGYARHTDKGGTGRKTNWYDTFRVGTDVRKTYIGKDTPEQAARLDQLSDLRAEGFMRIGAATGSLMSAMAKAAVFRLGDTIVRTYAFRLYESELGRRYVDRLGR